jgi:transcriptional regulator with XRE-family HTH domain
MKVMPATDIGARIRRRRQELRMSQRQLAEQIGAHPSAVLSWEAGRHFPARKLGALEAALGIDLSGQPDRPPLTPDEASLWALDRFSEPERRELIRCLKQFRHPVTRP